MGEEVNIPQVEALNSLPWNRSDENPKGDIREGEDIPLQLSYGEGNERSRAIVSGSHAEWSQHSDDRALYERFTGEEEELEEEGMSFGSLNSALGTNESVHSSAGGSRGYDPAAM